MNEKKNVKWSRLRADFSVLTDQHCQDNDICLLDYRVMVVTVILWFVYILDSQAASLIFFIMVASVFIFSTETCPGYWKKCSASQVNLFMIKLYGFAAAVLDCSLYILAFFSLLDLSLVLPG